MSSFGVSKPPLMKNPVLPVKYLLHHRRCVCSPNGSDAWRSLVAISETCYLPRPDWIKMGMFVLAAGKPCLEQPRTARPSDV